jgi:hypothetical protein
VKWPPLGEVPYEDKGLLGDPYFRNLKEVATNIVDHIPKIGTEVHGVDLTDLTDYQTNDIARLVAIRGVVFFKDQKNFDVEEQRKLGAFFGTLHKRATTSSPKCGRLDDVHVVWTDESSKDQRAHYAPKFLWHSHVSDSVALGFCQYCVHILLRSPGPMLTRHRLRMRSNRRLILALNSLPAHLKVAGETLFGPLSTPRTTPFQLLCKPISAHLRLCTPRKCNMMTLLQLAE